MEKRKSKGKLLFGKIKLNNIIISDQIKIGKLNQLAKDVYLLIKYL